MPTVVPKPIIAKIKRSGFVIICTDLDHAIINKKVRKTLVSTVLQFPYVFLSH
jgi:hypothetical protein